MEYRCEECKSTNFVRNGRTYDGRQKYLCKDCGYYGIFKHNHTPPVKNFNQLAKTLEKSQTFIISPETVKALKNLDKPFEYTVI